MPDLGGLFSGFFEAVVTLALLFIIVGWVSSKLVGMGQAFRNSHGRMLRGELERCFGGDKDAQSFTRYFYWHPIIAPLTQPSAVSRSSRVQAILSWASERPVLRRIAKFLAARSWRKPTFDYPPGRLPSHIAPETFAAAMMNPFPWPATEKPLDLLLIANREAKLGPQPGLAAKLSSGRGYLEKPGTWEKLLTKTVIGYSYNKDDFDRLFYDTPVDIHAQFLENRPGAVDSDARAPEKLPDSLDSDTRCPEKSSNAKSEEPRALSLTQKLLFVWCRNRLVPSGLRTRMVALIQDAEDDIDRLRASLARWYSETMERVTGRFKRRALFYIFLVALVICLLFNIDSVKNLFLHRRPCRSACGDRGRPRGGRLVRGDRQPRSEAPLRQGFQMPQRDTGRESRLQGFQMPRTDWRTE